MLLSSIFNRITGLSRGQKAAILLICDAMMVPVALFLVLALFEGVVTASLLQSPPRLAVLVLIMMGAGVVLSSRLGLTRIKLNAYEQTGILRTVGYSVGVGIAGAIGLVLLYRGIRFFETMALVTMVLLILSVGLRFAMRNVLVNVYQRGRKRQRVLIYGAGQTGVQLAFALRRDDAVMPVAFVDDNPTLNQLMVAGLPVYSPIQIESLVKKLYIDRVVLAMPSISKPKQARIARKLTEVGCDVSVLPSFASLVDDPDILKRIQPVNPADFLNRAGLEAELAGLTDLYAGRNVMITGAGGSIGSELVRQILTSRPNRLVLYEICEYSLYQIGRELDEMGLKTEVILRLGSVLDAPAVRRSMERYEVDVVLHAAAYKHVNLVEQNVLSGLRNNVLGTKVVAEAARDLKVARFVLVSTDKAVRPRSIMGASKRFAELIVQDLEARTNGGTRYSIVRFGNVLGSSGSVVPLFDEQIARGGPVTLTHNDVTRYFMTLSEAARLVLLTESLAEGGNMFVLDMGKPVRIRDLAQQMIELAGYTVRDDANPDGDIEIVTVGLAKGEKLHEELVTNSDLLEPTSHPKIRRATEECLSELEMASAIKALSAAIEIGSASDARKVLDRWLNLGPAVSDTYFEKAH